MLANNSGEIAVELDFDRDEGGRPMVTGSLNGEVQVTCQRCLDAMPFALSTNVRVGLVWDDEQARALAKDVEPWLVDEDPKDLYELVEDEILLVLPYTVYHDEPCGSGWKDTTEAEHAEENPPEKDNPFKVLEQLKKN
ncbi:MAG: YceD family protein [Cellvibrionaceae bacterium]